MSRPESLDRHHRAAITAALLGFLLAGLAQPLLELAFGPQAGASCSGAGRCCCRKDAPRPEGPCLTSGCGCSRPETSTAAAPLRIEAVLPTLGLPADPEPDQVSFPAACATPTARPDEPLVPPPRRPRCA